MTHDEIMDLSIQNIEEEEITSYFKPGSLRIRFTIDAHEFYIGVLKSENTFILQSIMHRQRFNHCPFCNGIFEHKCSVLDEHKLALFERLIEANHLRLIWLNRQYRN